MLGTQKEPPLRARMSFLPLTIFRKSAACPSSETLLAYRQSGLPCTPREWIELHLAGCDFCRAELQLLNRYRYVRERVTVGEIPPKLRKLAASVLGNLIRMDARSSEGCTSN